MKRIVWYLLLFVAGVITLPFAVLPLALSRKLGAALGWFLFRIGGSRRRMAIDNIERSVSAGALKLSEPAAVIAQRSFMNLGRSLAEILKVYWGFGGGLINAIEARGLEHFERARAKGKGIILITGHCGNWELEALAFGVRIAPFAVVARIQNNPYVHDLVERIRGRFGNRVIYKQGAIRAVMTELRANRVVGILMDQAVLPNEGFIIPVLGRGAWTTKMPAIIARKTGAVVLPGFIHREGDRLVGVIHPEVPLCEDKEGDDALIEDTRRFAAAIEHYITAHPDEWLWIHRRWKRVPEHEAGS
jgi:KDO2-lipid IV(A) lauroyltransferase